KEVRPFRAEQRHAAAAAATRLQPKQAQHAGALRSTGARVLMLPAQRPRKEPRPKTPSPCPSPRWGEGTLLQPSQAPSPLGERVGVRGSLRLIQNASGASCGIAVCISGDGEGENRAA